MDSGISMVWDTREKNGKFTHKNNMAKGNNAQKKEKKKPKQENSKSSQKGANKNKK